MSIAVVGAGAMGSAYSGLLAMAGNEVWVVDVWRERIEHSLRVTACMLAESLKDPLHWKLQPLRHLHERSNCYRLERQLPGGNLTH